MVSNIVPDNPVALFRPDNLSGGLLLVAAVDDGDDGLGQIDKGEARG